MTAGESRKPLTYDKVSEFAELKVLTEKLHFSDTCQTDRTSPQLTLLATVKHFTLIAHKASAQLRTPGDILKSKLILKFTEFSNKMH